MVNLFADIPLELTFTCPACGKAFQLPADHAQDTFICPRCKQQLPLTDEMKQQLPLGRAAQQMLLNRLQSD